MALNGDFSREQLLDMGWKPSTLDYLEENGFCVCRVTVHEPCGCGPCKAGQRWFYCEDKLRYAVAEFAVAGDGGKPWSKEIGGIRREFPNHTLIY